MPEVTLWMTAFCELCDEAEVYLRYACARLNVSYVCLDIVEHDEVFETLRHRIPVVEVAEHQLGWPFSKYQLVAWLTEVLASRTGLV